MDGSTPPPSALSSPRPRDFRLCYDDGNGSNDPTSNSADVRRQPWGVAYIDFLYSIETTFSQLMLSQREKDAILTSVSAAIIESVYEYGCLPQRRRKRRRQTAVSSLLLSSASSSRRAEILSISPGIGHDWLGECDDLSSINNNDNENYFSCNEIHGTVVIAFDEKDHPESTSAVASDFKSVANVVLSRIEEDMINGNYVDKVNNDMLQFGVTINNMKYIDSDYPDLAAQDAFEPLSTNSGSSEADMFRADPFDMTLFSKVAIPIMVVLSLLAMGLCWCAILSCPTELFFPKSRKNEDEDRYSKGSHNRHAHTGDRKDNNNSKPKGSSKESLRALSLEATLQDLSDIEMLTYGDQSAVQSMSYGNQRSYSTTASRNAQSSRGINRFLPTVDGNFHPSDTETGSSGHSAEMHYDMKDRTPAGSRVDSMKVSHRGKVADDSLFVKKAKRNATPIRVISSIFSKSNANPPANDLMDRINSCTSIPNNNCFGDEQMLPPSTMLNRENNNSTILRYVIPTVERSNSLLEAESPRLPVSRNRTQPTARSPLSPMGTKKSAAYREYINKKMLQREAEYEQPDISIPMEIGVKRTFTDAQGRIREMVAL
jgi:hypothetical protein